MSRDGLLNSPAAHAAANRLAGGIPTCARCHSALQQGLAELPGMPGINFPAFICIACVSAANAEREQAGQEEVMPTE